MAKFCENLLAGACAVVAAFSDGCLCTNETPLVKLNNSFSQLGKFFCFDTASVAAESANNEMTRTPDVVGGPSKKPVRFAPKFGGQIATEVRKTNAVGCADSGDLNFEDNAGREIANLFPHKTAESESIGQNSECDAGDNIKVRTSLINSFDNQSKQSETEKTETNQADPNKKKKKKKRNKGTSPKLQPPVQILSEQKEDQNFDENRETRESDPNSELPESFEPPKINDPNDGTSPSTFGCWSSEGNDEVTEADPNVKNRENKGTSPKLQDPVKILNEGQKTKNQNRKILKIARPSKKNIALSNQFRKSRKKSVRKS